jgi:glycosyltransferase involved in cell wall biosynthesis
MKLLIINELYQYGGAEMQTQREAKICREHGHEVRIITLDSAFANGWLNDSHYNISRKDNKIKTQLQRFFADREIKKILKQQIEAFSPDYIHINNAYDHAISIFQAVKEYKTLQTIRDYGAVCPNGLSIHPDKTICNGYQNCLQCTGKCILQSERKLKACWQWICFKRKDHLRKKCIKQFACPSQMLTDYCNNMQLPTLCINNPFDFSLLDSMQIQKKTNFQNKTFLYYGLIVEHKGIRQMIQAFSEFAKEKADVELNLMGRVPAEYESVLQQLIQEYGNGKIHYLGTLPYEETIKQLSMVYAVIIPSLWIENYPNTALEAACAGCVVLASERGGMKEIVGDGCFVFHVLQKDEIVEKFEEAYQLTQEEYEERITASRKLVRRNNTMEQYYERLMKCLRDICEN